MKYRIVALIIGGISLGFSTAGHTQERQVDFQPQAKVSRLSQADNQSVFIERQAVDKIMNAYKAKGFVGQVIISDRNSTIYTKSIGDAVKGEKLYTNRTVVDIASVSKQFTAAAIMKLVEQGELNLSAPISQYIDHVPADKQAITLHLMLSHTAGFKRHLGRDSDMMPKATMIKQAMATPLAFGIGERYHYSDIGYVLAAVIIEKVTGQSYEDYVYTNLWQPAGMENTGYTRPDWSGFTVPQIVEPYGGFHSPLKFVRAAKGNFWNMKGAGGVFSTSADMMKWHRALLSDHILTQKLKDKLFALHTPEEDAGYFYGYGWSLVPDHKGGKLIWHNGMSFFNRAEFWRIEESGMGIFVTSHTGPVSPYVIARDIDRLLHP